MSRAIRIKGDSAVFPGDACVHCLSPTTDRVELVKVKRSTVRRVSVPFCQNCIALRQARSSAQIRFERIASVASFLLAWAAGVWIYVSALSWNALSGSNGPIWASLLGVLAVVIVFGLLYLIVQPWSLHFRSPETRAVLASVVIRDFDWETTMLVFADEEYGERFARVNQGPDAAASADKEASKG
jgi:hypothetical protein